MIELVLKKLTPSLNVTQRQHWKQYAADKAEWLLCLAEARGIARQWHRPLYKRCRLTITRKSHQPITDNDNMVGGVKNLVDCLVHDGYMVDDNDKVIVERVFAQEKVKKSEACTVVRIEAVP
jgi:Holliday junction resolvase RusA-like endonuclease